MTRPPPHLSITTARWFADVLKTYDLAPHHVRLLTLACEAWDRAQQAREEVAKNGATYKNRWGEPRAHPSVAIERDARISFARLLRELALDTEPNPEVRPPRISERRA